MVALFLFLFLICSYSCMHITLLDPLDDLVCCACQHGSTELESSYQEQFEATTVSVAIVTLALFQLQFLHLATVLLIKTALSWSIFELNILLLVT